MSTPTGGKVRIWRIAGDVIALAAGAAIALASIAHPAIDTTGLGVGLISLSVPHLEEDLNLGGA